MNPEQKSIFDLLPAEGEISFDEWKLMAGTAGVYGNIRLWRSLKQSGLISLRNVRDPETNNLVLMVGRAS